MVRIVKRLDAKNHFKEVELRIGHWNEYPDNAVTGGTTNPIFGTFNGLDDTAEVMFTREEGLDGRYLTVETWNNLVLEVNEIHVITVTV